MKLRILLISSLVLVVTLFGSSQVQNSAGQALSGAQANEPESLVFTFQVPALQPAQDGLSSKPALEGYVASGAPGDPLLPAKAYNIALPPDVIPESVQAQVIEAKTVELDGTYTIEPAPPGVTWIDDRETMLWGENAASIVDGKNTLVYQNDAFFPQSQLISVRFDQLRKWRMVSLLLAPLQYNPVTGKLRLASEVQVQVTYQRFASVDQRMLQIELSDTVMDERAVQLFYNYAEARAWYPVMAKPDGQSATHNYVIITTKNIVTASKKLSSFVAHKQAQGYSVLVATEAQYGVSQFPSARADTIRLWLKNNYQAMGIEYVLLIGDPTPYDPANFFSAVGDVPMFMCWPMHRYLDDKGNPSGERIPTDYLYANLTGNWNLNQLGQADQYCGELTDDDGPGGMSFQPNVYVGRIPVYQNVPGWVASLDSILNKTILYEDSGDMEWRKRALLPMSFSDATTDSAYLAEAMKSDYLNAAGYDSHTLYMHYLWWGPGKEGTCYSNFASTQTLLDGAVRDHWKNRDYGIVTWHAHGGPTSTGIGYGVCSLGNVLTSADASLLNDSRPAIVFSASCYNGWPENSNSLGYALLKQGAITVVSSSRMSGYYLGVFHPNRSATGNADIAYYMTQRIVNDETAGKALYDEKYQMSLVNGWNGTAVVNSIDFNLYGDPSLSINDGHPVAPSTPTWLAANTNATGGIDLTWLDNSDNELGFVVERAIGSPSGWSVVGLAGINQTSWPESGLSCGSHYYYRLHALNSYGNSGNSNQADAWSLLRDEFEYDDTYTNAKSITPYNNYSSVVGQSHTFHAAGDVDWVKLNATWGKTYTISTSGLGTENDTVLTLYDSTGSGWLAENDDCTPGSKSSCLTNWVAPSTGVFYIKVTQTEAEGGCADYEYNLQVIEGGFTGWPAQPTNLTATPVSHCKVDLAWTSNNFTDLGTEIERFGWEGTGSGYGIMWWKTIATVGTGVTHYSDTGLECNKTYPYRVRTISTAGKSFYSNTASALTLTADSFEADNSYAAAKTINVNGVSQAHNFHIAGDQDWVKFTASAGQVYTITTSSLGAANDTELKLYDKNGTTQLEYNDDCAGLESCIKKWAAPSSGVYYVKVYGFAGKGGCPGYQYTLSVTGTTNSSSLLGPSGLWLSDYSVSSLLFAWPDLNTSEHAFKVERWQVITGTVGMWRQIAIAGPGLLYRSGPENDGGALPTDGNASFRDSWLTCNTTYSYRIRAFDDSGDSPFSEVISATTPLWDAFEPDGSYLQAHPIYTSTLNSPAQNHNLGPGLDLDWFQFTATAGEVYTITTSQFTHSDSYTPTLALYGDPTTSPLLTTQHCGADSRTLCLNGWTAPSSATYYLLVSGEGGCPGHDYFLNLVDSHLSESWPAPPTVFTGTLTLPDQIDLTWTDNADNEYGYRLERLAGVGWLQIADIGFGVTKYRDAGLACGQTYQYRLFAYNFAGNSAPATLELSTPACLYPIPYNPLFLPIVRR